MVPGRFLVIFGHMNTLQKKIELFRGREVTDLAPFNIDSPLRGFGWLPTWVSLCFRADDSFGSSLHSGTALS